ncbi:LETM1 domain-containing protein mdm28 mitochondrial [Bienertia sinuspersici]
MQGNESFGLTGRSSADIGKSDSNEYHRFELLRSELVELEKRVQRSTTESEDEEDVWQGTQLLAIDVAAATGLLRRAVIGDELTEKEKKYLRRTLTDMANASSHPKICAILDTIAIWVRTVGSTEAARQDEGDQYQGFKDRRECGRIILKLNQKNTTFLTIDIGTTKPVAGD